MERLHLPDTQPRARRHLPPADAVKARVHYRLDGKTKRPTFNCESVTQLEDLRAFTRALDLAYRNDWPADSAGKPTPPVCIGAPTPDRGIGMARTSVSGDGRVEPQPLTASRLVRLVQARLRKQPKAQGGAKKTARTLYGYQTHQNFFLRHARYLPGDPRLELLGLQPGDEWVFDNPEAPLRELDIRRLLLVRGTTHLDVRASNEAALRAWCRELEKVAAGSDGLTEVPDLPEFTPEEASARTIEAFAQQLGVLLNYAYDHELIPDRLWSQALKDEVPTAAGACYTTRTVPSRYEICDVTEAMSAATRTFRRGGTAVTVNGERYAAMIWLAGRAGPRPEETIAIRNYWVLLDPDDPRIELRYAETVQPKHDGQPRERAVVPLKHHGADEIRVLRPDPHDRAEFIDVLNRHRQAFVDTSTHKDPYFFTSENGGPVTLANFNRDWWRPVRDQLYRDHRHFSALPFRRLRAAAITDWLAVRGWSTRQACEMAGNTDDYREALRRSPLVATPDSQRSGSVPPT